jgi:hypothetical protein
MEIDFRLLRKRCEERLAELEFASPFNARSFCVALAVRRARPIRLRPTTNLAGPCGLWVATADADYLFFERNTSPLHQEHIILHEASHILCGHESAPFSDGDLPALLFPHVRPETIRYVLKRGGYSRYEECEAELMASLLLERAVGDAASKHVVLDAEAASVIGRLEAFMGEKP